MFRKLSTGLIATLAMSSVSFAGPFPPVQGRPQLQPVAPSEARPTATIGSQTLAKAEAPEAAFAMNAAYTNLFQIAFSDVVLRNSTDPQSRDLALQMQRDGLTMNESLQPAFTSLGLKMPTELPETQVRYLAQMNQLPPDQIDRAYLASMKLRQSDQLTAFVSAQSVVRNPALRTYIDSSMPKLRENSSQVIEMASAKGVTSDMIIDGKPHPDSTEASIRE